MLFSYDSNGGCGQTLISMNQPGENTLLLSEYESISCADGNTELNFTIGGSVGQFDIIIDGDVFEESVGFGGLAGAVKALMEECNHPGKCTVHKLPTAFIEHGVRGELLHQYDLK